MPFHSTLMVCEYKPNEWVLVSDLVYVTRAGIRIVAPRGFITDLASIPQAFRNVFNVNGASRRAAVIHDYLYCTHGFDEALTRADCDAIFSEALKSLGISLIERNLMYAAVRIGGGLYWNKRVDGLRQHYDFVPADYWSQTT